MNRIRIAHLITTLTTGGAERMLLKLVDRMDRSRFETLVISLVDEGTMGPIMREKGITVETLGMPLGKPTLAGLLRFRSILQRFQPSILQTWLYHADFLGTLVALPMRVPHLCWNLRCTEVEVSAYSRITTALPHILARLSSLPEVVIANSERGRTAHQRFGYHPKQWQVLPNGFDTSLLQPMPQMRAPLRKELGIPEDALVVGLLARFDVMKDHATFLRAAAHAAKKIPQLYCVLAGRGVTNSNPVLQTLLTETGLLSRCALLGERSDISALLSTWDIAALSSAFGEGFPNVVGEAMACGLPCAVTDVGDAAMLVEGTGLAVPIRNPTALGDAFVTLLSETEPARKARGNAARQHIVDHYDLAQITRRYEQLYEDLANNTTPRE